MKMTNEENIKRENIINAIGECDIAINQSEPFGADYNRAINRKVELFKALYEIGEAKAKANA